VNRKRGQELADRFSVPGPFSPSIRRGSVHFVHLTELAIRLAIVAILVGLLGSVGAMVRTAVRLGHSPDDPLARFTCGYEGAFALSWALACCLSLGALLMQCPPWPEAVVAAVIINLLGQPIAYISCRLGVRKVVLGLLGRVDYVGRLVPEQELADLSPWMRRGMVGVCLLRGVFALSVGLTLGVACAWPIVRWISA